MFTMLLTVYTLLSITLPALCTPTVCDLYEQPPCTDPSITIVTAQDIAHPSSPISEALIHGNLLYVSGILPLALATGNVTSGGIDSQTRTVLQNCKAVIEAAGSNLGKVIKVDVFLKNISDYDLVNEIYADFFGSHRPARTAVVVVDIPAGALIEVDMMGVL